MFLHREDYPLVRIVTRYAFITSHYTQNTRLSTSCQKIVIIDHFWIVRVVTVTVPFLTTLREKLGQKVVTLTTQKLSLGCH